VLAVLELGVVLAQAREPQQSLHRPTPSLADRTVGKPQT
jgi:hypothetical protein